MSSTENPALPAPLAAFEAGRRITAFVSDDASIAALRTGLAGLGAELDLRRGTIRQAIAAFEKETPTYAVIVDISGSTYIQEALDDLARVCPPDIAVFVIGDSNDIVVYRQLVQELGVTEYLLKPLTRDTVQRLLFARLSGGARDQLGPRGGQVIAVCGAAGGVGTTTTAVSLALELAGQTKGQVALLDLHLQGGTSALMLSATPGPGLRIALEDAERADSLFLERTALTVDAKLRLIAAQESFDTEIAVTEAGITRLLELLRRKFNYIVVDLPKPVTREMQAVIAAARQVAVVLGPDLASLRDAQALRRMIATTTGNDKTITVLNRADAKGGLTRPLIEKGLGRAPDCVIPDLGRRMLESVNLGTPAVQRVPALRKHLAPLLREVAGLGSGAKGGSLLRRLLRS